MAQKIKLCKEKDCDNEQTTSGYCRYHYLKNWRTIKYRHKKQSLQSLNKYIDHICTKYPDAYVDAVKRDLRDPDFFSKRAESFFVDDGVADSIDELSFSGDMSRLLTHLKVDRDY